MIRAEQGLSGDFSLSIRNMPVSEQETIHRPRISVCSLHLRLLLISAVLLCYPQLWLSWTCCSYPSLLPGCLRRPISSTVLLGILPQKPVYMWTIHLFKWQIHFYHPKWALLLICKRKRLSKHTHRKTNKKQAPLPCFKIAAALPALDLPPSPSLTWNWPSVEQFASDKSKKVTTHENKVA